MLKMARKAHKPTIRLTYEDSKDASYSPCGRCGEYIWPDEIKTHINGICCEYAAEDQSETKVVPLD
jgi:hypothetical protein